MIVVRRIVLNRLPQYSSPAPKMTAMTIAPIVIWLAEKPAISAWSGKRGSPFASWKTDWLSQTPMAALTAIQVGASSHTCDVRTSSR